MGPKDLKKLVSDCRNKMIEIDWWERVPQPWKPVEIKMASYIGFRKGMFQH